MPMYTYRREDGTTFDFRQNFTDEPLTLDPQTGQRVVRVVQAAGIIFKGAGFYVNDSKSSSKTSLTSSTAKKDATTATSTETSTPAATTPKSDTLAAAAD
ncbi:MAG: zinc ribbon domain-containing protein [Anaerolineae bacterium]|nr:zinc ribbon domain-containing protein [Anaerolineae bacterium]